MVSTRAGQLIGEPQKPQRPPNTTVRLSPRRTYSFSDTEASVLRVPLHTCSRTPSLPAGAHPTRGT